MPKKKSFFESLQDEVCEEVGEYVKEKVKRKLIRVGEMSFAFLFGFALTLVGIAQIMAYYIPYLENGFNYLVLGILFLIIGLSLK